MKSDPKTSSETYLARSLAAEDLRCGDFVSVLYEIVEWPSFFWSCDPHVLPPSEPVRMATKPSGCGNPLKVKEICLPFVFVKLPSGQHEILDVRRHGLVRLNPDYAHRVWKTLCKQQKSATSQLRSVSL